MRDYYVYNIREYTQYSEVLCSEIKSPVVLLVNGEMGVGKTTLCNSLCLKISGKRLLSSSYNLISIYTGQTKVIHCDFFRKTLSEDIFYTSIYPLLTEDWVLMMEWQSTFNFLNSCGVIKIDIELQDNSVRRIRDQILNRA